MAGQQARGRKRRQGVLIAVCGLLILLGWTLRTYFVEQDFGRFWPPSFWQTPSATAQQRPNIIVIVIDTLRADHLRLYGHSRQTTPVLDHVASEGVLFERDTSVAAWTLPSVSSILTGLPPSAHGVRGYEDQLPDKAVTLAERLKSAGYHTAFVGVNSLFEAGRNLQQGFDHYFGIDEIPGEELNTHLMAWLKDRPTDKPTFLYAHYFDPHCRYIPPEEYRQLYWPPSAAQRTHRTMTPEQWRLMHECFQLHYNPGEPVLDVDYYLAEYDAEIRHADHVVGMFLERLKTAGLYDSSIVIITSDHGEEFYDHGGHGHGKVLLEHNIHVPLIIRMPGGALPGRRVSERVSSLDLTPTLLDVAGVKVPESLPGLSLRGVLEGRDTLPKDRMVFAETDYEGKQRAVLAGDDKLLLSPNKSRPTALYDLKTDPGELQDVQKTRPDVYARLSRALAGFEKQALELGEAIPGSRQELTQETIEQLRSLGYTP